MNDESAYVSWIPTVSLRSPNKNCISIEDLSRTSEWPLMISLPWPCHELENVIPIGTLGQLQRAVGRQTNAMVAKIEAWEIRCQKRVEESFWLYFDVKEGLDYTRLTNLSQSEKQWFGERLNLLGLTGKWKISGYGRNIVSSILDNNCAKGEFNKAIMRDGRWSAVFLDFFAFLSWFFAGGIAIRT